MTARSSQRENKSENTAVIGEVDIVGEADRLKQRSLWLARITLFLGAGSVLALLWPIVRAVEETRANGELIAFTLIVESLPSLAYIYALWTIQAGFRNVAAGGGLSPVIARSCTRSGAALAIGGALSAVGVPNLLNAARAAGVEVGEVFTGRSILHFDVAYLAVGLVGIALMLLGDLLNRAHDLHRRATSLEAELNEFF